MSLIHVNFMTKQIIKVTPSLEKKWDLVKPYFERCYSVKFRSRLKDEEIEFLYGKMKLLSEEADYYIASHPRRDIYEIVR
jgi:hypothetical protein